MPRIFPHVGSYVGMGFDLLFLHTIPAVFSFFFRDIRKKVTYTNLSSSIYEFLNSTSILI